MLYDKDIRDPLFDYLEEKYGKIRLLEEQVMGQSRADMVMVVPDALYGIEIKSDADTYARLDRQIADYDLYYDYNIVVVGSSHTAHIEEHVPAWWGIITVDELTEGGEPVSGESISERTAAAAAENGEGPENRAAVSPKADFYMLRSPQKNPKLDWSCKIEILWRPELAHIQELNRMAAYKQKSKQFVRDKIIEKVPIEILCEQVSTELFERDYTKIWETIQTFRKENGQKPRRRRRRRRRKKTNG